MTKIKLRQDCESNWIVKDQSLFEKISKEYDIYSDKEAIITHMTNADRIREMDDEAIANVLLDWFCIGNRECYTRNREEVRNEILQWLQSNALV